MDADTHKALESFAKADLRAARKQGDVLIGQTTHGTLALSYDSGMYRLCVCGIGGTVLAAGKAATVRAALITSYALE